jgi:hypothetical protein
MPEPNSGCWIWTRSLTGLGQAQIKIHYRSLIASRVAYEEYIGEIPPRMIVRQQCGLLCCVNPAHLFLTSNSEFVSGMVRDGRRVALTKEVHPHARLTVEKVSEIRSGGLGGMSQRAMARAHGVNQSTISRILSGKRW